MLPEEVSRIIGQAGTVRVFQVEKGAIKKFADAVDDRNPLYWDEDYAAKSKYGGIIAPPGFFGWPPSWEENLTFPIHTDIREVADRALAKLGAPRGLDGGIEYEFFLPVRAGDSLAVLPRIADIIERQGEKSRLYFIITELTYTNQNGDVVAISRHTNIRR